MRRDVFESAAVVPAAEGDAKPGDQAVAADAEHMGSAELAVADAATADAGRAADGSQYDRPAPPPGVRPIGSLTKPGKATVEGRIHSVEIRPVEHSCVLACLVTDGTGEITALFYGRTHIPGVETGSKILLRGRVGVQENGLVMINPAYELIA